MNVKQSSLAAIKSSLSVYPQEKGRLYIRSYSVHDRGLLRHLSHDCTYRAKLSPLQSLDPLSVYFNIVDYTNLDPKTLFTCHHDCCGPLLQFWTFIIFRTYTHINRIKHLFVSKLKNELSRDAFSLYIYKDRKNARIFYSIKYFQHNN